MRCDVMRCDVGTTKSLLPASTTSSTTTSSSSRRSRRRGFEIRRTGRLQREPFCQRCLILSHRSRLVVLIRIPFPSRSLQSTCVDQPLQRGRSQTRDEHVESPEHRDGDEQGDWEDDGDKREDSRRYRGEDLLEPRGRVGLKEAGAGRSSEQTRDDVNALLRRAHEEQAEEGIVVLRANACVEPDTVMVEFRYAFVARPAMFGRLWRYCITNSTKHCIEAHWSDSRSSGLCHVSFQRCSYEQQDCAQC